MGLSPSAAEGDRHIFRPKTGRKMSQSPARERLPPAQFGAVKYPTKVKQTAFGLTTWQSAQG